jgi:hypothetical protein
MRWGAVVLGFVIACGGDVRVTDGGGSAGGAGAGNAAGGDGGGGAIGGSSAGLSVWPGQTYSNINCIDGESQLFIEIWPDTEAEVECVPSPEIDAAQVLVIGIEDWDFSAGVFPLDEETPHGTARAASGASPDFATGTLTIEPFVDVPGVISWDFDAASGSTDLSLCYRPPSEPCATPI